MMRRALQAVSSATVVRAVASACKEVHLTSLNLYNSLVFTNVGISSLVNLSSLERVKPWSVIFRS